MEAPISALAAISSLVQPPITECPTASLAGPDHLISGNLNATLRADGGLTVTRVSDGKVMLSEKSVRRLTPTTTTPPLAGFSSLEMAIDAMERRRTHLRSRPARRVPLGSQLSD